MKNLVENKIVNIEALKQSLTEMCNNSIFEDKEHINDIVDKFVVQHVEIPAAKQAGLDHLSADIYDCIDNVDELRDTQRDFVDEITDKLGLN